MFLFLLIVQSLVALGLIIVILMQRSEGGGLAGGGSPSGLMTARGAADFLTRATTILATAFVLLSIALAAVAANRAAPTIDVNAVRQAPPPAGGLGAPAPAPLPGQGAPGGIPGAQGQPAPGQPAPPPANQQGGIPLAQ